ncbi:hypothetical protein F7219_04510 [Helicobacter pylori]|nr:hypothetical protein [Helicobacter pylori]
MSGFSERGGVGVFTLTPLYFLMVISNMLGWCDRKRLLQEENLCVWLEIYFLYRLWLIVVRSQQI